MEYIYAALLLHNSGKEVTEDAMTAIMKAAGVEAEVGRVKALISALSNVDIDEAMAQAQPAYATAAAAPAMPVQAPAAAPAPEAGEAEKKEKKEKKEKTAEEEEKAEETGMEGLSSLFG